MTFSRLTNKALPFLVGAAMLGPVSLSWRRQAIADLVPAGRDAAVKVGMITTFAVSVLTVVAGTFLIVTSSDIVGMMVALAATVLSPVSFLLVNRKLRLRNQPSVA